jgi:hypothetical protein
MGGGGASGAGRATQVASSGRATAITAGSGGGGGSVAAGGSARAGVFAGAVVVTASVLGLTSASCITRSRSAGSAAGARGASPVARWGGSAGWESDVFGALGAVAVAGAGTAAVAGVASSDLAKAITADSAIGGGAVFLGGSARNGVFAGAAGGVCTATPVTGCSTRGGRSTARIAGTTVRQSRQAAPKGSPSPLPPKTRLISSAWISRENSSANARRQRSARVPSRRRL